MNDKKLIKRCQKGDKVAFHMIITKYHPIVFKFLLKLTKDYHITEDLAQETFFKMIRNIERIDAESKNKLSTYLLTIAKNSYIDEIRKKKNVDYSFDFNFNLIEDTEIGFEENVINRIDAANALEKLSLLPNEQRSVINLKYIEDLSLNEIAEIVDIEPKTVKSRIHNGITKLRRLMEG